MVVHFERVWMLEVLEGGSRVGRRVSAGIRVRFGMDWNGMAVDVDGW